MTTYETDTTDQPRWAAALHILLPRHGISCGSHTSELQSSVVVWEMHLIHPENHFHRILRASSLLRMPLLCCGVVQLRERMFRVIDM